MRRKSARQIRAERNNRIALAVMGLGLVLLFAGGVATNFETQYGLDHTKHFCALWSYVAVLGSFLGLVCVSIAALWASR